MLHIKLNRYWEVYKVKLQELQEENNLWTINGSSLLISLTTDIEIGNYVFGTGMATNTRVIDTQSINL